jgi:hypothetical protein
MIYSGTVSTEVCSRRRNTLISGDEQLLGKRLFRTEFLVRLSAVDPRLKWIVIQNMAMFGFEVITYLAVNIEQW